MVNKAEFESRVFGAQPGFVNYERSARPLGPVISELYDIEPNLVLGVIIEDPGYTNRSGLADEIFPELISIDLDMPNSEHKLHRRLQLALAEPTALPIAQARLGGDDGLEIPLLNTFLETINKLDASASEAVNYMLTPWLTLLYKDPSNDERRVILLYEDWRHAQFAATPKTSMAPIAHDVSVDQLLDGSAIGAEPIRLNPKDWRRDASGLSLSSYPDSFGYIQVGERWLYFDVEASWGLALMTNLQIAKGSASLSQRPVGRAAHVISTNVDSGSMVWQRKRHGSGGCGPVTAPSWS